MGKETIDRPRVLVLEGLGGDTADILEAAGADARELFPWDLERVEDELAYGGYHALVLTGGSDIDPRLYGAKKPHKSVYGVDQVRDTCELAALEVATTLGIPVLGICRGSQIMCAFRGGKLTQDIHGHRGTDHVVHAENDARTFRRAIAGKTMDVISLHHQCVRRPGKGMRIAARAPDRTPEAIESKDGLWLGVQFHPELAAWSNPDAWAIFRWLVQSAGTYAGVKVKVPSFRDAKAPVRASWTPSRLSKPAPKPAAKHRQAGGRVWVGAKRSSELELHTCPECGILFDCRNDRDDHLLYLHGSDMAYDERWG